MDIRWWIVSIFLNFRYLYNTAYILKWKKFYIIFVKRITFSFLNLCCWHFYQKIVRFSVIHVSYISLEPNWFFFTWCNRRFSTCKIRLTLTYCKREQDHLSSVYFSLFFSISSSWSSTTSTLQFTQMSISNIFQFTNEYRYIHAYTYISRMDNPRIKYIFQAIIKRQKKKKKILIHIHTIW